MTIFFFLVCFWKWLMNQHQSLHDGLLYVNFCNANHFLNWTPLINHIKPLQKVQGVSPLSYDRIALLNNEKSCPKFKVRIPNFVSNVRFPFRKVCLDRCICFSLGMPFEPTNEFTVSSSICLYACKVVGFRPKKRKKVVG